VVLELSWRPLKKQNAKRGVEVIKFGGATVLSRSNRPGETVPSLHRWVDFTLSQVSPLEWCSDCKATLPFFRNLKLMSVSPVDRCVEILR
jgi:hypothetical protein